MSITDVRVQLPPRAPKTIDQKIGGFFIEFDEWIQTLQRKLNIQESETDSPMCEKLPQRQPWKNSWVCWMQKSTRIDYEYLKKHPKIIIGYSDVTALLLAIYAKTGLITFYGPAVASSFGELPPFVDWTFDSFNSMIKGTISFPYCYEKPEVWTEEFINWAEQDRSKEQIGNDWICVNPGICQGRMIGGNLNTMEGFWGTEYMPEIKKGDILFIEDSLKDACTIERSFSLLKLAGVFEKVSGIILGKHENSMIMELENVLMKFY